MVELSEAEEKFVLHWGEIGNQWGVNRSESQIHALLFVNEDPLPADEISEVLGISRSNVSMSLKSLRNRDLAQSVQKMGERKEFFTTSKNVWETFKILARERRNKHLRSTLDVVNECLDEMREGTHAHEQLKEFQDFLNVASYWFEKLDETGVEQLKEAAEQLIDEQE